MAAPSAAAADLGQRRPDAGLDGGEDRALDERRLADADPLAFGRVEVLEGQLEAECRAPQVEQDEDAVRARGQRRSEGVRDARGAGAQSAVLRATCGPHGDLVAGDLRDHLAQPVGQRAAVGDQDQAHQSRLLSMPPGSMPGCSGPDLSRSQQRRVRRCVEVAMSVAIRGRRPLPDGSGRAYTRPAVDSLGGTTVPSPSPAAAPSRAPGSRPSSMPSRCAPGSRAAAGSWRVTSAR